jgi:hypothetical protein
MPTMAYPLLFATHDACDSPAAFMKNVLKLALGILTSASLLICARIMARWAE